jgi:hypothetical protein
LGTKLNRNGTKACRKCKGEGDLKGMEYSLAKDVIDNLKFEIENYTTGEYKDLLK